MRKILLLISITLSLTACMPALIYKMIKKINLMYRRLMFKYSKQDMKAILKYDPLDILN